MRRTKTTPKKKRAILVTLLFIAVLLAVVATYTLLASQNETVTKGGEGETINLDPATDAEKDEADKQKIDRIESQKTQPENNASPTPSQGDVSISSISQNPSTQDVVVQTRLKGSGWKECKLTLSQNNGAPIIKTAETLFQQDYSICMGYAISENEFSTKGVWTAQLTATKSDGSSITSKSATVEVR